MEILAGDGLDVPGAGKVRPAEGHDRSQAVADAQQVRQTALHRLVGPPQTVLLVDDDHLLLQMYEQHLVNDQFEVVTAPSGEACLRLLEERTPAAIVLDLVMPGLDGFSVLRRLSKHPDWRHIPVLVFSTRGAPEDIDTALELGATDYIVKTQSTPRDLVEKVGTLLGRRPGSGDPRRLCIAIDRKAPASSK